MRHKYISTHTHTHSHWLVKGEWYEKFEPNESTSTKNKKKKTEPKKISFLYIPTCIKFYWKSILYNTIYRKPKLQHRIFFMCRYYSNALTHSSGEHSTQHCRPRHASPNRMLHSYIGDDGASYFPHSLSNFHTLVSHTSDSHQTHHIGRK